MREANNLVKEIIKRLKIQGYCQVEGYKKFVYLRETDKSVFLLREKDTKTRISHSKIARAIEVVQKDPAIYDKGPSGLRGHITTHIHSPLWSLLHLLTLNEITENVA